MSDNADNKETPGRAFNVAPCPDVLKFGIGDIVYHRLDPEGSPGMVLGHLSQPGHYKYLVRWENQDDTLHFDIELSTKPYIRDIDTSDVKM